MIPENLNNLNKDGEEAILYNLDKDIKEEATYRNNDSGPILVE